MNQRVWSTYVKPASPVRCGDYDLDYVSIEIDDGVLDWRLELGSGLGIYWAVPGAKDDRLRLFHVDGAAYAVDEPELEADPFVFDLPQQTWEGELAQLPDGSTLISIAVQATAEPPAYRCEIGVRTAPGEEQRTVFAWQGPPGKRGQTPFSS